MSRVFKPRKATPVPVSKDKERKKEKETEQEKAREKGKEKMDEGTLLVVDTPVKPKVRSSSARAGMTARLAESSLAIKMEEEEEDWEMHLPSSPDVLLLVPR